MLGGIDPVIVFQFSKLAASLGSTVEKIPVISTIPTLIAQPPIPVYLDENRTGIFIQNEAKSVMIQTETETKTDGSEPDINQKGISSDVTIKMTAKRDSLGIALLGAFIDQLFDKSTSKEYSISYFHGPIVILRALLIKYDSEVDASNDLINITLMLSKGEKQPTKKDDTPVVNKVAEVPL